MPAGLPLTPAAQRWELPGLNCFSGHPDIPGLNLVFFGICFHSPTATSVRRLANHANSSFPDRGRPCWLPLRPLFLEVLEWHSGSTQCSRLHIPLCTAQIQLWIEVNAME